jgi:Bifunctional DNA primase/polymerase, N-terminal
VDGRCDDDEAGAQAVNEETPAANPSWCDADDPIWGLRPPKDDRTLTLEAIRTRGWQAVLLAPRTKRPQGTHWTITTVLTVITRHLDAGGNLGLLTHQRTGLAVLDPDQLVPWGQMIDMLGQPAAAWVLTGSGRVHYYVTWEDLPAKLEGWDGRVIGEIQRGPGQQMIVAPPSIHPDTGARYRWLVDPVTEPLEPLPSLWRTRLWSVPVSPGRRATPAAPQTLRATTLRQPGARRFSRS